jgi:hypothetical protein
MRALRFDLIFSYWIFIWVLIYLFKWTIYSPKFALIVGLIENCFMLILMFLYGTRIESIIYFIIINIFIKVVPLYYLRNYLIKWKDIYFTFILFIIFIVWLHLNKESLTGNLKLIYNSLINNKNKTPFLSFIQKFKINWKNYYNPELL